jgi:hypothetical protein
MDASILSGEFPWLSWTSNALVIADVFVGLLVIVLVSCLIGQLVTAGHESSRKGVRGMC